MFTGGNAQTHVFKVSVCKGFQWVLFVATLVFKMNEWGPFTSGVQTHKDLMAV